MEHDMAGKSGRDSFDPQNFLAKVRVGKATFGTVLSLNAKIFRQRVTHCR